MAARRGSSSACATRSSKRWIGAARACRTRSCVGWSRATRRGAITLIWHPPHPHMAAYAQPHGIRGDFLAWLLERALDAPAAFGAIELLLARASAAPKLDAPCAALLATFVRAASCAIRRVQPRARR
eukprot:2173020-Prymnesium_polylepis.1